MAKDSPRVPLFGPLTRDLFFWADEVQLPGCLGAKEGQTGHSGGQPLGPAEVLLQTWLDGGRKPFARSVWIVVGLV